VVRAGKDLPGSCGAWGVSSSRTVVLLAGVYLIFLLFWGLNYRRLPLTAKLDDDPARVTPAAARALAARTIALLNADGPAAHASPWPEDEALVRRLEPTFKEAARAGGDRRGIVPGLPKTSLGDVFLGASGTAGFTNPVTHEVALDRTVLDCEKPFLLAHEWGHLAGFADESEASFVGLLACARSSFPQIRYAGWLALYEHLPREALEDEPPSRALPAPDSGSPDDFVGPSAGLPALSPLVRADLRAMAERAARRRSPWISRLSYRAYDRYLKANRVPEGIASYGLVVRLILGVRFEEPWVPASRPRLRGIGPALRRRSDRGAARGRSTHDPPRRRRSGDRDDDAGEDDREDVLGDRDERIFHAEPPHQPRARLVPAEGAEHAARRARDRAAHRSLPARRAHAGAREGSHQDARRQGRERRPRRRLRELIGHQLQERSQREDGDGDRRSHEPERRAVEIQPSQVRGPGDHRGRRQRPQPGNDPDREGEDQGSGRAHGGSPIRLGSNGVPRLEAGAAERTDASTRIRRARSTARAGETSTVRRELRGAYRVDRSVWIDENSIGLMKCASKPAATEFLRSTSLP
jgi:hypothetical protein